MRIENGELDQHEGSVFVGTILKEIYVDSALKKADKLDKQHESEQEPMREPEVQVSWKEYKRRNGGTLASK